MVAAVCVLDSGGIATGRRGVQLLLRSTSLLLGNPDESTDMQGASKERIVSHTSSCVSNFGVGQWSVGSVRG
jgi:hypothetical protein